MIPIFNIRSLSKFTTRRLEQQPFEPLPLRMVPTETDPWLSLLREIFQKKTVKLSKNWPISFYPPMKLTREQAILHNLDPSAPYLSDLSLDVASMDLVLTLEYQSLEMLPGDKLRVKEIFYQLAKETLEAHTAILVKNGLLTTTIRGMTPNEYTFDHPSGKIYRITTEWGGSGLDVIEWTQKPFISRGGNWVHVLDPRATKQVLDLTIRNRAYVEIHRHLTPDTVYQDDLSFFAKLTIKCGESLN